MHTEVESLKVLRFIEWVLVGAVIVLIVVAFFTADNNHITAMVCGVIALALVVTLSSVTHYIEKHY